MYTKEEQKNLKTTPEKILILEDNPKYQILIKESLLNEFDIIFEVNDQMGLEIAQNTIPNLLIFNIQALRIDVGSFLKLLLW
ncbi:MAG: hypothetical protein KME60_23960 [Cyanomargarita calcarea GSE-NOS-MK-12-04C]|jgi:CheY-like chemotaxis protein|uniref:Response regulatory domain-containing protein n=1 Tax=Cyanomargarita calcarea GSE-NOS-MK-12-04C TaxID=2839659 RepID=A0A951QSR2_9CYAN|nr:hypothetical protein [Cyanomargarita calcarea GSE-NOS-MK-12-04C]